MATVDVADQADGLGRKSASDQLAEVQKKYQQAQSNFDALKALARRALTEFDELRKKCDENYEQCVKERKAHDESRQELSQVRNELLKLKHTTQQAYEEYGEFQDKLDLEKDLREKAEEYAREVVRENKVLREMLKESGGSLPKEVQEPTEDEDEPSKKDLKTGVVILHEQWTAAEQRLAKANADIEQAQSELKRVKAEAEAAQKELDKEKTELEHMKELSRYAVEEFEQLQSRLETETEIRLAAERYAAQQHAEANMVKRQSALVLSSATESEQVAAAFQQLEEMNKEISEMKSQHKEKVEGLEAEIERLTKDQDRQSIEEKIILANEHCELLEKKVQSSEERAATAEHKVATLEHELALAKAASPAKGEAPPAAPAPPPPPPPPPPPAPVLQPLKKLVATITAAKGKKKENPSTKVVDPRQDAMAEMMERIKSGKVALRRADESTEKHPQVKGDAMEEIAKMIKQPRQLKKTIKLKSEEKPAASSVSSELQKKLDRRARKITGNTATDGEAATDSSGAADGAGSKSPSPPAVCVTPSDETEGGGSSKKTQGEEEESKGGTTDTEEKKESEPSKQGEVMDSEV